MTGTVLAQAIPLFGTLILARQYSPNEFGVYAAWLSAVMLLGVALTAKYELALAIENDGEPRRLVVIVTVVTTLILACVAAIVNLIALILFPIVEDKITYAMLILFVPTALLLALMQTMQHWAAAEGEYRKLTYMRVAQAIAITGSQVIFGATSISVDGLVLGHFIGGAVGLFASAILMPIGVFPKDNLTQTLWVVWIKHRKFPALSLPSNIINTAAANIPVMLVASRYGTDIAGQLAMTMKVLGAPIGVLGSSVLDVFKRYASATYREKGECRDYYIRTFRVLAIGSILFCITMMIASEALFITAFGDEWRMSGSIAIWMLPMFALRFVASPLSYMIYIAGKQQVDLYWQLTLLVVTILALSTPVNYKDALILYSAGYGMLYLVYIAMSYKYSKGDK